MIKKNSECKIMIVEDEAIIAMSLEQTLIKMHFNVVGISYSGKDALEKAASLGPDLILMDIMLPGKMDGIEIAKIARSELNIPVIFLTAFSEDNIIERAKEAEPFGYILKPFQDREIKAAIEVALYKKEMEEKLRKAHDELEHRVKERTHELNNTLESLKRSESELTQNKLVLERLNQELMDTNVALSVVANNINKEKQKLEEQFYTLCNGKVIPILKNLQNDVYCNKRQADLELTISYLKDGFRESPKYHISGYNLSEQEMRVALMIKNGLSNQQIADMLCLSIYTIRTHRKNIRNKFCIKDPKVDLVSYLRSRFNPV